MYLFQFFQQIKARDILSKLCDNCRRTVSMTTLQNQGVLSILGQLSPGFCNFLSDRVMALEKRQQVFHAKSDDEALSIIHQVS